MIDVVTDIPSQVDLQRGMGSVADTLTVVSAPAIGRFVPAVEAPARVEPGQLLGHITGGKGRADEVVVPVAGTLKELLARPGQLVGLGQGLAWLERVAPTGCEGDV